MEIWKPLNGEYKDRYEVSNLGRVRSLNFTDCLGRLRKGKVLVQSVNDKGYFIVRLSLNSKKKSYRVHRLIAIAFINNPNNLLFVNHKDGVKSNNSIDNLEWVTSSENQNHAIRIGLKKTPKGNKAFNFKGIINVYNLEGELIDTLSGNEDMKNKGYDFRNVSAVVLGKRKTYKNLIFKRDGNI